MSCAGRKGGQGADECFHDEEHLGSGHSDRSLMQKCSYNLTIGRNSLAYRPKTDF